MNREQRWMWWKSRHSCFLPTLVMIEAPAGYPPYNGLSHPLMQQTQILKLSCAFAMHFFLSQQQNMLLLATYVSMLPWSGIYYLVLVIITCYLNWSFCHENGFQIQEQDHISNTPLPVYKGIPDLYACFFLFSVAHPHSPFFLFERGISLCL